MSSGGGGTSTTNTVTNSDPWAGVQPYLKQLYSAAGSQIGQPNSYYPGLSYTPQTGLEQQAQQGYLDYASNTLPQLTNQVQGAYTGLLGSLDVANNPYVQGQLNANAQSVTNTLQRDWLPSIQNSAIAHGQLGGSREGVAQGIALGDASQALASANAATQLGAYGQGLSAVGSALPFASQLTSLGLQPYDIQSQVGQAQRSEQDLALQDAMNRYYYNQQAPLDNLSSLASIFAGSAPYASGSSTSVGPNPYQSNTLQTALGLGSLGIGAYSSGLLGGLGSLFSSAAPTLLLA